MQGGRRWSGILLAAVLGAACFYDAADFEGDASITDRGYWSWHPRHTIRFRPPASISDPGAHDFRFKGAPPVPLTLHLNVQGNEPYDTFRSLTTSMEVVIRGEDGDVVRSAAGPLHDWTLMWTSQGHGSYWHRTCAEIRFESSKWYVLNVTVNDVDPVSPKATVEVILAGGGHDSP